MHQSAGRWVDERDPPLRVEGDEGVADAVEHLLQLAEGVRGRRLCLRALDGQARPMGKLGQFAFVLFVELRAVLFVR